MDSPDVMQTINDIRRGGTQDEKDWASFLLVGCKNVLARSRSAQTNNLAASDAEAEIHSDNSRLAVEKKLALETLLQRCKGVGELTREEQQSLRSDLTEGSSSNASVLGRLHALISSQDDRWSAEQNSLITGAIYSGDPIVQREAYFVIQGTIDKNAPGGVDRGTALEKAFPPEIVSQPLSNFEKMGACYIVDRCT